MVRKCVRVSKASRQRPDFRNPRLFGLPRRRNCIAAQQQKHRTRCAAYGEGDFGKQKNIDAGEEQKNAKRARQAAVYRAGKKIGVRLQLKQLNPKTSHCQRKQAKANDRDEDTGQQGGPEPDARQQKRKGQEHRQSGDDIPKGVPSVIGNFLCRLFFYVKPDQRQHRH